MAMGNWTDESLDGNGEKRRGSLSSKDGKLRLDIYKNWLYLYFEGQCLGEIREGDLYLNSVQINVERKDGKVFSKVRDLSAEGPQAVMLSIQRIGHVGEYIDEYEDGFVPITDAELDELKAWANEPHGPEYVRADIHAASRLPKVEPQPPADLRERFEAWSRSYPGRAGRSVKEIAWEAAQWARAQGRAESSSLPDVDELAQHIRSVDGNNRMGAGALAESIVEWLEKQGCTKARSQEFFAGYHQAMIDWENGAAHAQGSTAAVPKLAQSVIDAARCIRHWHDNGDDGMVVSAEHVRALWKALHELDAAAPTPPVKETAAAVPAP